MSGITELRAAADGGPDAALLADLMQLAELSDQYAEIEVEQFRRGRREQIRCRAGIDPKLFETALAIVKLQDRIAATPAQTPTGVLEKMRYATDQFDDYGSWVDLPMSAIRDVLAVVFGITGKAPNPRAAP